MAADQQSPSLTLPSLTVKWGSYQKPAPEEEVQVVTTVTTAMASPAGPLITRRLAVEKLAPVFGIENVDAVLEEIEKEAADKQAKDLEKQEETLKLQAKHAPAAKTGFPPK